MDWAEDTYSAQTISFSKLSLTMKELYRDSLGSGTWNATDLRSKQSSVTVEKTTCIQLLSGLVALPIKKFMVPLK